MVDSHTTPYTGTDQVFNPLVVPTPGACAAGPHPTGCYDPAHISAFSEESDPANPDDPNASEDHVGAVITRSTKILGSISGMIWLDSNTDATIDPGETFRPEGVPVSLYRLNNTIVANTTTNASGRWEFANLEAGAYYALVGRPTAASVWTTKAAPATQDSLVHPTTSRISPITLTESYDGATNLYTVTDVTDRNAGYVIYAPTIDARLGKAYGPDNERIPTPGKDPTAVAVPVTITNTGDEPLHTIALAFTRTSAHRVVVPPTFAGFPVTDGGDDVYTLTMGAATLPIQGTLTGTVTLPDVSAGDRVDIDLRVTGKGAISGANTRDEDPYTATVGDGTSFTILIRKQTPGRQPLDGAQFAVLLDDQGQATTPVPGITPTPTQGLAGQFEIADLPAGTYWLRETTAPPGHTLPAEDVHFRVADTGALTLVGTHPLAGVEASGPVNDTLVITNLPARALPAAGGTPATPGVIWVLAFCLGAGALTLLTRNPSARHAR